VVPRDRATLVSRNARRAIAGEPIWTTFAALLGRFPRLSLAVAKAGPEWK
jgi:hypothetical protein